MKLQNYYLIHLIESGPRVRIPIQMQRYTTKNMLLTLHTQIFVLKVRRHRWVWFAIQKNVPFFNLITASGLFLLIPCLSFALILFHFHFHLLLGVSCVIPTVFFCCFLLIFITNFSQALNECTIIIFGSYFFSCCNIFVVFAQNLLI